MAEFPNVYSCVAVINAASTAGATASFGFLAKSYISIENLSSVDLFVNLKDGAATTEVGTINIGTCGITSLKLELRNLDFPISGIGLHTTSTGAGGNKVNILAIE